MGGLAGRAGQPGAGLGRHAAARTAAVWAALDPVLERRSRQTGRPLQVVDAGGGTGGFAVRLSMLGNNVTVVDPSPDSLAAAQRRAAEAQVQITAVQGDATDLLDIVGPESADLVLCHSVLEYVDDPAATLAVLAQVVRPGGTLSTLVAGAIAAVLHRALAGRFDEARQMLASPAGTFGAGDPMPRRFTMPGVTALVERAGLTVTEAHGVRVFADLVPSALVDTDPAAEHALAALEMAAASHPALRDVATQLHVLGER